MVPRRGGVTRGGSQCVHWTHGQCGAGPGSSPFHVVLVILSNGDYVDVVPPACPVVAEDLLLSWFLGHIGVDSACLLTRFEHSYALQTHRLLRHSWILGFCSIAPFLFIFALGFGCALTLSTCCRFSRASFTGPPGLTSGDADLMEILPCCFRSALGGKIALGLLAQIRTG